VVVETVTIKLAETLAKSFGAKLATEMARHFLAMEKSLRADLKEVKLGIETLQLAPYRAGQEHMERSTRLSSTADRLEELREADRNFVLALANLEGKPTAQALCLLALAVCSNARRRQDEARRYLERAIPLAEGELRKIEREVKRSLRLSAVRGTIGRAMAPMAGGGPFVPPGAKQAMSMLARMRAVEAQATRDQVLGDRLVAAQAIAIAAHDGLRELVSGSTQ
jgi:tetratricopeptide (TPR) repeat protein